MRWITICLLLPLMMASCKTRVKPEPPSTATPPNANEVLKVLAAEYKNGQVTRCKHAVSPGASDSTVVYFGARNAPDAGAEVFDAYGKKIGACYYSTNRVDPICEEVRSCEDVYRVHPNIWNQPGIELKLGQ